MNIHFPTLKPVACTINTLQSSYDGRYEYHLYYKCILPVASVVNYDHTHDATIWNILN
jgi:hypothetical protein